MVVTLKGLKFESGEAVRPQKMGTFANDADAINQRAYKIAKIPLVPSAGVNSYVFAWQNPEANKIIIREVLVIITAASVGAATMDVCEVANATSNAKLIFDALALNAIGQFGSHNVTDTGATGNEKPHVVDEKGGASDWVTGYEAAGVATTGLVGNVYIFYISV